MARFEPEFNKVIFKEGGYVNDPDDKGGETYLGISRVHNPTWTGWAIIDKVKKEYGNKNLTKVLKKNKNLTEYAKLCYKINYWDKLYLDDIPSQKIASQMFDAAVNMGIKMAITIAQQVLGMTTSGKWSKGLYVNLMNYGKERETNII